MVYRKGRRVMTSFRQFDEDKSGRLDYMEFRHALTFMGVILQDDEFEYLMAKIDSDGSGVIDYNEFAQHLKEDDVQRSFLPSEKHVADAYARGGNMIKHVEDNTHANKAVESKAHYM